VKITKTKGFSLVEVVTVLAIFVIMASIASVYMSRYVNNTNLRTAARQLASDIANSKQRSVTQGVNYRMTITVGTPGQYTIEQRDAADTTSTVKATKIPTDSGAGLYISNPTTYTGNVITFQPRGTTSAGTVILQNSIGSSASITTNITGKTYVTYTMQ
jgi:type II secretion system protein H